MEPLTGKPHLRRILVKRYLSFIKKIESSDKKPLRVLLEIAKKDVRTTTGSNLRRIMLMAGKESIDDLHEADEAMEYHKIPEREAWRVDVLKELVDTKQDKLEVDGIPDAELEQILNFVCTE